MATEMNIISIEKILSLKPHYNISIDNLREFLDFYRKIEGEDKRNPMFSKTKKYEMFARKITHVSKINSTLRKGNSNGWKPHVVSKEVDKLKQLVTQYLNKITKEKFKSIKDKLISEVIEIPYLDIIPILANGILKKTYMDKSFINLYIELCAELWSFEDWYKKMICIRNRNGLYYILNMLEIKKENKYIGPFKNRMDIYKKVLPEINFKKIFVNLLRTEFYKRDEYYKLMEENRDYDDIYYQYKQKVYGIIDIVCYMFDKKYINQNIITTCLVELLGIKKDNILENDILLFIYMFKKIYKYNDPKITNFIIDNVSKMDKENFSFRTKFLLEDLFKDMKKIVIVEKKIERKVIPVQKIERYIKPPSEKSQTIITEELAYEEIQQIIDKNIPVYKKFRELKQYKYDKKEPLIVEIILMKVIDNYDIKYNNLYKKLWRDRVIERRHVEKSFDLIIDNYDDLLKTKSNVQSNLINFLYYILSKKSGISLLKIILHVVRNNRNYKHFKTTFNMLWQKIKKIYPTFERQVKRFI